MTDLRIGLTGGIGAGKSTVAGALRELGAAIVDADVVAREVVEPGRPALASLVEAFGEGILAPDGSLDRPALAGVAFVDAERTAVLNSIVHPAVAQRTAELMSAAADVPILVHDVPLLVENSMQANYHLALLVDVPAEVRLERLVSARGMDPQDARARIARQADDAARRAACDVLIDNAGPRGATLEAVRTLFRERLVPFAANIRAGRPAGARASSAADPAAVARLKGRIERSLQRAGEEDVTVGAEARDEGVRVVLHVPEATQAEGLGPVLAAAGYPRVSGERFGSADPACAAEVLLDVGASAL